MEIESKNITYRKPDLNDGSKIWNTVKNSGVLDLNSSYMYILLTKHFSDTCIVAEYNNKLLGFVTGYIIPNKKNTYFLWQVGVEENGRGKGIASKMIFEILKRNNLKDINYLETTVTPSNIPSRKLFEGLAKKLETKLEICDGFNESLFPSSSHESEDWFRIGSFSLHR